MKTRMDTNRLQTNAEELTGEWESWDISPFAELGSVFGGL